MRILILGAKGMLGNDLLKEFSEFDVVGWDKNDLNITSPIDVKKKILKLRPEIIINSAAYTDVDEAENNYALVMKINGEAVNYLVETAQEIKAKFIQISTDYVFDGQSEIGYEENCKDRSPLNIYGISKLMGENLVEKGIKGGLNGYIIRISYLFGRYGNNLVDKIIKLVSEKDVLKVVNDQRGTLTFTEDLSKGIMAILKNNIIPGIYHMTNANSFSCYELAKEISKILHKNVIIEKMLYADYPAKTKRPINSVLLNTKLPKLRSWKKAVKEYIELNEI